MKHVLGGRLKRPSPCRIRSAPGRDRVRGLSETSEKSASFCIWAVYARVILRSWHIYAELERKKHMAKYLFPSWHHCQFLASYFVPTTLFSMVTPQSVWSIVVRLLCRCFSISDFPVTYLCSSVRCLRGAPFPTQRHHYTQCPCRFFILERYNLYIILWSQTLR